MRYFAALVAVALTSCATAPIKKDWPEDPCQAVVVSSAVAALDKSVLGEGVWMCTDLAAKKAGKCAESETGYKDCQKTLKQTRGWSWQPLVTGIVVGATAGIAASVGAVELRDWLKNKDK